MRYFVSCLKHAFTMLKVCSSEGKAGEVHGGDRLPWVRMGSDDNFAPLRSLEWQVHVYGEIKGPFATTCRELGLPAHVFAWNDGAEDAGIKRDAAYLVRPDGHVALASPEQSVTNLRAYVERLHLRFSVDSPAAPRN